MIPLGCVYISSADTLLTNKKRVLRICLLDTLKGVTYILSIGVNTSVSIYILSAGG